MKKLVSLILLCGFVQVAWAQSPLTFGPKVGFNYSTLVLKKNADEVTSDYFAGVAGGAFVRINLGKVYLQPEVYLNGKGADVRFSNDNTDPNMGEVNGKVRLTALDMPVLLGYKIIDAKVFNLRMMGGPVVSWVLKENRNDLKVFEPDAYESYNSRNIGFQAGLGIDIANITIDARYEAGLNQIKDHFNQRNKLFHLSLGIKLF